MKSQLIFTMSMAATAYTAAIPEQQVPEQQLADPPVKPYGLSDIINAAMSAYQYLSKVATDAGADLKKGTPIPVVVDQTIPKVLPEAKLHSRVAVTSEKKLRPEATKSRAMFGPHV